MNREEMHVEDTVLNEIQSAISGKVAHLQKIRAKLQSEMDEITKKYEDRLGKIDDVLDQVDPNRIRKVKRLQDVSRVPLADLVITIMSDKRQPMTIAEIASCMYNGDADQTRKSGIRSALSRLLKDGAVSRSKLEGRGGNQSSVLFTLNSGVAG